MDRYDHIVACDLDGTVFPNGPDPFSSHVKHVFRRIVADPKLCLVYASGRSLYWALEGIKEFDVPKPNVYIGGVGTVMYFLNEKKDYILHNEWHEEIKKDWGVITWKDIYHSVKDISVLTLQEGHSQNPYKLSFYIPIEKEGEIVAKVKKIINKFSIQYEVIAHVDKGSGVGYLDIIPASATKEHALRYLEYYLSIPAANIIFAGDGGNDIHPLTSGYKAIVVNNATDSFKEKVRVEAEEKGIIDKIYFAKGNGSDNNGNYLAGVVEGLNYFNKIN